MSEERNARFNRPIRAAKNAGEPRNPAPKHSSVRGLKSTPEADAFLRRHAHEMTATDIGIALNIRAQDVRERCRMLGLTLKTAWTNESPANAADDFKPTPLPPDWTLDAPAGSAERIAKLRERADSGYELWGPNDYARPLPRCEGKIEAKQMENVT